MSRLQNTPDCQVVNKSEVPELTDQNDTCRTSKAID